nr:serine/threonine-protein kinase [Geodermatophilus dictyosporus]
MDGRTLGGRYRLDSVLGRGGMGTVHAATDAVLGRRVAVKVLDLAVADDAGMARFRREAQVLAALEHPFVVTVFDFGVDASAAWLVMPLLPGPDLLTLVNRDGPLPVDDVARHGRQVAEALAAAHGAGIVHRDVKPANLMLAADGSCLLLDLGIARLTDRAGGTSLTGTGLVMGSMPFLAPEVIAGEPAGPAADLYGLGATLFTLLTGRPPFDADGAAVLAQHLHAVAPSAASLRPDTPAALDRLLTRLLDKDPAARPSAAQVAGALAGVLAAAPDRGSSPTLVLPLPAATAPGHPADDGPRRRPVRLLAALGGGVAVLAVAGALWAGWGADPATSTGAPASTSATAAPTTAVASTPAPAPAPSVAPTTTAAPTPSPTPAPAPAPAPVPQPAADPVQTALAGLRATVDGATSSGALTERGLRDVDRRVADIEEAVARGDAEKAGEKAGELEQRLEELQRDERLTADGAVQLAAALGDVRAALGVSGRDDDDEDD